MTDVKIYDLEDRSFDMTEAKEFRFVGFKNDESFIPAKGVLDGSDLVVETEKVTFYAKADLALTETEGHAIYDTLDYHGYTELTFKLEDITKGVLAGKTTWKSTYQDANHVGIVISSDDFTSAVESSGLAENDAVTIKNLKIYQKVGDNGVAVDITSEFTTYFNSLSGDDKFYTANSVLKDHDGESFAYTFNNYASDNNSFDVTINGTDMTKQYEWIVKADEDNDYIGTRLYESAVSTSEDESFYMGTGNDTITFKGDFGDDTITYSEGETLALSIKNMGGTDITSGYVAEVSGNDVILSVENTYYLEATAGADFEYDGLKYEKGKTYNWELKQLSASGDPSLVGKYTWLGTSPLRDMSEAEAEYWGKSSSVGLVLDLETSDFNTDGSLKNIDVTLSGINIKFKDLQIMNNTTDGLDDYTSDYYSSITAQSADIHNVNETLYESQVSGSLTLEGLATSDIADNGLTINTKTLNQFVFDPAVSKKGSTITYTGSRFKEELVSTDATEVFDLKTGEDEISFSGNFGKDTVVVTKSESSSSGWNTYDLNFYKADGTTLYSDVPLVYTESGNNLVISTDVKYYAEATFAVTGDGKYDSLAYKAGTYTFELKNVKSESAVNAKYAWICTGTDVKDQDVSRAATDAEKELGYKTVSMILNNSEVVAATSTDGQAEGNVTVKNLKVYQVVNGEKTDVTDTYKAALAAETTETAYSTNKGMFNEQISGQVTVKDYLKKDTVYTTETYPGSGSWDEPMVGVMVNGQNLESRVYDAIKSGNSYKGSRLSETATSTSANESFNLGTTSLAPGEKDSIKFKGNFGKDTVTMNADEQLNLKFFGADGVTAYDATKLQYSVSGNKLTISKDAVSYYAEATFAVTGDGKYDSLAYKAGTYRFELKNVKSESDVVNAKYAWICTGTDVKDQPVSREATPAEKELGYKTVSMILSNDEVTSAMTTNGQAEGNVTVKDLKVYQVVNGTKTDITDTYKTALTYDKNKEMFNEQFSGSVTISNYDAKYSSSYGLEVNGANIASLLNKTITPVKNKFTGTAMNDTANSTKENETFDLKTSLSKDTINFVGRFGDDKVVLNKGEVIDLNIAKGETTGNTYTYDVVGKDLVITAENMYYLEATAGADFVYDGLKYEAGKTYNWELKQLSASGDPSLVGKYTWLGTSPLRDMSEAEAEYWGKSSSVGLVLDLETSDFNTDGSLKNIDVTVSGVNIKLNSLNIKRATLDAVDTNFTSDYYDLITAAEADIHDENEKLFNKQSEGIITLKDYAAKDTGATVLINNAAFTPEFTINAANLDESIVKGKITGSTANDDINISSYLSTTQKGLTVNSGSGNDSITGSLFNDTVTVKSLAGQSATVNQNAGVNKVNLGKGNDKYVGDLYASSTVNAGVGDNVVEIKGTNIGTNKITAKNGNNNVTVNGGVNTIKLGNASDAISDALIAYKHNELNIGGGQNTATTGKGKDEFVISNGINNINSGAGEDKFNITGGYNVIKTGAGDKLFTNISDGTNMITTNKGKDRFVVAGGTNIINSGAGNDTFVISNGTNNIAGGAGDDEYVFTTDATTTKLEGSHVITDAKGNDEYDFSALDNIGKWNNQVVSISDTKGANEFEFDSLKDYIFDVNLTLKKGEAVKTSSGDYKYSLGNDIFFSASDITDMSTGLAAGVDVEGRKQIDEIEIGASSYKLDTDYINTLAQSAANYVAGLKNGYTSVADVLANGSNAEKSGLLALYADTATMGYEMV